MADRPIRGVPTRYNGTLFRSRLEARWAVFFDLVGWPWAYEPIDLAGYIPDFVLRFPAGAVAVEVKPAVVLADLEEHAKKITVSGWGGVTLALGAVVWPDHTPHGLDVIGYGNEVVHLGDEAEHAYDATEAFRCIDCGAFSIRGASLSYRCHVNGCYDGDGHVGQLQPGELAALWADAGNRVQWRGPENTESTGVRR